MPARLKGALVDAARDLNIPVPPGTLLLEHPATLENGDYASGLALKIAKKAGVSPRELAEKLVAFLETVEGVQKVQIAGAGFINFYAASSELAKSIDEAREEPWGRNDSNKSKKILIEYTDPNPFKEFHIGHLMSNAIGESLSRLLEFSGAEVRRANYQGDVGPHVAKAIWGYLQLESRSTEEVHWNHAYVWGNDFYERDEKAKEEIHDINRKVYEKSDPQINQLYEKGKKISLERFEKIYNVLGTKFDHYFFESDTAPRGIELVKKHPKIFVESDGAVVYHGPHTRVFLTSKGLPTYETKELGLAELKWETWKFDSSITITAHEQADYFAVVLSALKEVLPDIGQKISHVSHGMMRFAEGKMSSRAGNIVTGESLLQELTEAARTRASESRAADPALLAQQIAVAAIKYQILKQRSDKDIIFDRERALSLEGDSGPYLQYAHARAHALVEKANEQGVKMKVDAGAEPSELSRLLHRFPEAVEYATREMEPHLLTNYLLEFASAFNRWYANEHILDGTPAQAHKVALADAARATLKNGLWLLGIPAPEKM